MLTNVPRWPCKTNYSQTHKHKFCRWHDVQQKLMTCYKYIKTSSLPVCEKELPLSSVGFALPLPRRTAWGQVHATRSSRSEDSLPHYLFLGPGSHIGLSGPTPLWHRVTPGRHAVGDKRGHVLCPFQDVGRTFATSWLSLAMVLPFSGYVPISLFPFLSCLRACSACGPSVRRGTPEPCARIETRRPFSLSFSPSLSLSLSLPGQERRANPNPSARGRARARSISLSFFRQGYGQEGSPPCPHARRRPDYCRRHFCERLSPSRQILPIEIDARATCGRLNSE